MVAMLELNNEQNLMPVTEEWHDRLSRLLDIAAQEEGVDNGEVSLSFVDDGAIRELNRTYRNLDKPTDVLTFAMRDTLEEERTIQFESEPMDETLGDIVISITTAKRQSGDYGHSLEREICFLFIHGFLHLLGYDHQTEEEERRMFDKQERILEKAGLTR